MSLKKYSRVRQILILFVFTVIISVVSIVFMDLLIWPISIFAVRETPAFTAIVVNGGLLAVLILVLKKTLSYPLSWYRDDKNISGLMLKIISRPLAVLLNTAVFIITSAVIIVFIYAALYYNISLLGRIGTQQ